MTVYFVVNADVTDNEQLTRYRAATTATFEGHDLEVLVSDNEAAVIEGDPIGTRVVVLRFPDRDAFERWYHSPAYQAIIGMRTASTDGVALLATDRRPPAAD